MSAHGQIALIPAAELDELRRSLRQLVDRELMPFERPS